LNTGITAFPHFKRKEVLMASKDLMRRGEETRFQAHHGEMSNGSYSAAAVAAAGLRSGGRIAFIFN
jgi:hypothetical protein